MESRERIIELIVDHCQGATDNIADGVYYNDLANEIWKKIETLQEENIILSSKMVDYMDKWNNSLKENKRLKEFLKEAFEAGKAYGCDVIVSRCNYIPIEKLNFEEWLETKNIKL